MRPQQMETVDTGSRNEHSYIGRGSIYVTQTRVRSVKSDTYPSVGLDILEKLGHGTPSEFWTRVRGHGKILIN